MKIYTDMLRSGWSVKSVEILVYKNYYNIDNVWNLFYSEAINIFINWVYGSKVFCIDYYFNCEIKIQNQN